MKTKRLIFVACVVITGCEMRDAGVSPTPVWIDDADRITAAYHFSAVQSLAASMSDGLVLLSVRSDHVGYDGYAPQWCFVFSSGGIAVDYHFHATATEVGFDSTSKYTRIGSGFIQHPWFDSDRALQIAEAHGGGAFRMQHPHYAIEAGLGEPLVPRSTTYWYLTYRSRSDANESLLFGIDANTGEVTLKYP